MSGKGFDILDRYLVRCTTVASAVSQVKFLEGSLQQAKHAESGRNALIKQVTKLEEEVKHSRHRLEKRHAEALVSVRPLVEHTEHVCRLYVEYN